MAEWSWRSLVVNRKRLAVTASQGPQPLCQPPPTACLTASGAASEVPFVSTHPWGLSLRASSKRAPFVV